VRLGTAVPLAPLHHPLRLAEDLAVVDQLSEGRLDVGVAPGYKPEEFATLGVPKGERGARTDETIEILKLAWRGEPFSYTGKHFRFDNVTVLPPPAQRPGPPLWIGGSSLASARRAARHGAGFMPDSGATPDIYGAYRSGLAATAGPGLPVPPRVATNRVLFAAESREKAWELCGEHLLYQFNKYRQWFSDAGDADTHGAEATDPAVLSPEHYFVGTPDDILAAISDSQQRLGYEELVFWARPPGMPAAVSTASLELIARHVLPALRETAAVRAGGNDR
jgi:alkanesulfonate monooxygenase SsuD/methylene tetrahydromethanopterin reductase-like flavin-dependent oxidoreductase (luciferase family)